MNLYLLTSIINFTAGVVCLITAVRLYFATTKSPENIKLKYFFYGFIFITIYLLATGIPLFITNPLAVSLFSFAFIPFLLISGMFLCLVPINFTRFKKYEKLYTYTLLFLLLLSTGMIFFGLSEPGISFGRDIESQLRPESTLITYGMIISGIAFIISLLFSVIFYFRFAIRRKNNKLVFGKSLMIGIGCTFFILAVFSNYIIGANPKNFLEASVLAGIFFMIGALSFISSTLYKGERKKY